MQMKPKRAQQEKKSKRGRGRPFKKGMKRHPRAGRVKGAANRVTLLAKEMIESCAREIGGLQRMIEWVLRSDKNETIFWGSIYPRMLPLQVNALIQNNLNVKITREELAKQLEAKCLPPLVFGRDGPKRMITVEAQAEPMVDNDDARKP